MKKYALFSFINGAPSDARKIYRKLYGYKLHGKHYKGFLEKYGGLKLGSGAVIVPLSHADEIKKLFTSLKIEYSIYEVSSDTEIV